MSMVKRYKDMGTDFDGLYKDVVKELQNTKGLNIANEIEGEINGKPFRSVTATRVSIPRVFAGALREATVTITGEPNDFVVEVHTGAWFNNLLMPGAGGLIIAGPIGGAAGAGAGGLVAAKFRRTLNKKVKELVKEHSEKELTEEKEETFAE